MRLAWSLTLSLIFVFASRGALAADNSFGQGMAFEFAAGKGGAQIENPDKSIAHYDALSVVGKMLFPIFESQRFAFKFNTGIRYLDLQNTANSGAQREVANVIGPGAGLGLRLGRFSLGYDYNLMVARHYAVGAISDVTKYETPMTTLTAGFSIPLKQISVSFQYSQSNASVPAKDTGLVSASPYEDEIYWIGLSYATGESISSFFDFLY
jgi:hypothetical protein